MRPIRFALASVANSAEYRLSMAPFLDAGACNGNSSAVMTAELVAAEARDRVGRPPRAVEAFVPSRSRDEVRQLAIQCLAAGAPWVVSGAGAPDPVVVVGRSKDRGADLRTLLPELIERSRGKGGGSPDLVQVSAADAPAAAEAVRWAGEKLASLA